MSLDVERANKRRALDFAEKQQELLMKINHIINTEDFKNMPKPDSVSTPIQELRSSLKPILKEFENMLRSIGSEERYKAWKAKHQNSSWGEM
jgi:hypothetical protein